MTLLLTAVLVLQIPAAQTALARRVVRSLEKKMDGRVEFSDLTFVPFSGVVIKDLAIIDNHPWQGDTDVPQDTLFSAKTVAARFTLQGLLSQQGIQLRQAEVEDARLALVMEPGEEYSTNLTRVFRLSPSEEEKEKNLKDIFSIRKVSVDNFHFRMINYADTTSEKAGYGMDWGDLDLVASVEGRDLKMSGGVISGKADRVVLSEKSGYSAVLSADASVGNGVTELTDVHIRDPWSDVTAPKIKLTGTSDDFSDFVNKVRIDGELKRSTLAFKTLSYFAPGFKDNGIVADIASGRISGPVNRLRVDNFSFRDRTTGFGGQASVTLSNMTDPSGMGLNSELKDFTFTSDGLGSFLSQFIPGKPLDLSGLARGETFTFNGRTSGSLADLDVDGTLESSSGRASARLNVKDIVDTKPIRISGNVVTDNLDIGRIIGQDFVGPCSLRTDIRASLPSGGSPTVNIDSLSIGRLHLMGYDYSGIHANGKLADNAFDGRIICNDPNINFMFQGLASLNAGDNAEYRFYATLGYADLHALNFDKREISRVSLDGLVANFEKDRKGDLIGRVDASGLLFESANGRHDIGDIHVGSSSGGNDYRLTLTSDFLDGTYEGTRDIGTIIRDIQDITTKKEIGALFGEPSGKWDGASYRIALNFHDSRDLLAFLAPGAYIADSTAVRMRITEGGRLTGNITSPRLAFKDKYMKGFNLDVDNGDDALNCTLTGTELSISQGLQFMNNALMLYANDNNIGLGYNYNNMNDTEDRGELYFTGDLSESSPGKPVLDARSLTSNIYIKGEQWRFDPASYHYSDGSVRIVGLNISSGEQNFAVNGGISQERPDTLMVSINNVDLSIANAFSAQDLGIEGIAYGRAMVTSPVKDKLGLMVNVSADSTSVAGRPAGTVTLGGSWDLENGLLDYALRNSIDGNTIMDARGYYIPKDKSLGLNAGMEGFDIGYATPFLKDVFSEMGGRLTGQVTADGPTKALEVAGDDMVLEDGLLRVAYTNVPYYVNGPLHINNSGVYFDNLAVRDRSDGRGTISGGILFDRFSNIRMNTRIRLENMEVLDLGENAGEAFYGNVFGTGRVNITGPFSSLLLDVDATTVKGGSFHIPLGSVGAAGGSDLLIFKEPVKEVYMDPYELMMNRLVETRKEENDLAVRLRVNATPQVEANLEVDKSTGNVFTGRGAGTIALEVRPSKDLFSINGDYTLNGGNYHFNGMGITSKDFTVLDGSSVKFNGDIMDSDLSIDARYSLKTSLSNLIADTTSVGSRRTVDCGLSVTGKLSNPQLSFSIDVPDLDPMTRSRVESALSTDDKVQKQFMALLITNNFLPDEQSGIVNNSNLLTSNVADLMANQLNNILQKLDIPLDLGLNYAESGSGTSIFDVALSTQLFNNRVIVNGSVGNRKHMTNNSDVVGDLDIEVKMDKTGQVRLNLFSHSADEYTNYLDNSQRNGVGVAYQKEFDTLRQFFRDLFSTKAQRQARELEKAGREEEKVTIIVEEGE
ncbi:MAG: translocation/assembly module TamB domain-containing protein [Bacteroidales bacterium]|nr:translocation/assembly module TamB domain-containing protein [Bacteroidales bacterium]